MSAAIRSVDAFAATISPKTIWVFLRVVDADGIVGWGEATLTGQEAGLSLAAARIGNALVGRPALPVDRPLADSGVSHNDRPGAAIVSAIDQALWDIAARRAGVALHAMLGTTERSEVPIYANINRRTVDRSPQSFAASASKAVADGYDTVKIAPFDEVYPGGTAEITAGVARARAVRDEIGPSRKLYVDCHWRFDEDGAKRAIDALSAFGLDWFECPIPEVPASYAALSRLKAHANAAGAMLAGCETGTGLESFRPYIDGNLYDVLMPDVKYAGGLSEFRRIAAYAAERGVQVAPHNPTGPVSHVASLHLCAGLPGFTILEHQYDESPAFFAMAAGTLSKPRSGKSKLPNAVGLGISLDLSFLTPLGPAGQR